MSDVLALLSQRRRDARIGTVVDVATGGVATVDVDGASITAQLTDQTATVGAGALVTLLPVGDTWQVIASLTSGGAGGPVLGSNLLANPSFEFGQIASVPDQWDAFWTNGPAATTWDDTGGVAHTGAGVAQVVLTPTADPVNANLRSAAVALDPGVSYRCGAWLKASTAPAGLSMAVIVYSAPTAAGAQPFGAGSTAGTMATVALPGAAWQEAFGTFVMPTDHHYASLFCNTSASVGATLTTWWDDAAIRQIIAT